MLVVLLSRQPSVQTAFSALARSFLRLLSPAFPCVCLVRRLRRRLSFQDAAAGFRFFWVSSDPERVRVISIARLRTLPPLHLQPIAVIVFDAPCVEFLS